MATLTIQAGPLSSSVSISNEKLQAMADAMIAYEEETGPPVGETAQERLDWFTRRVGQLVKKEAYEARRRELSHDLRETLNQEYNEDFT